MPADEAFAALRAHEGRRQDGRRGVGRLVVLALIVLAPAVALFGLWRFADARDEEPEALDLVPVGAPGAPIDPLRTGLLSWRRLPALVAEDTNLAQFRDEASRFADTLGGRSCVMVSLDGTAVANKAADRAVIPASSMKLLVGAVALEVLGREHVFTTTLVGTVEGNAVIGDLTLVGGGDPLLTSEAFPTENDGLGVFNETSLDDLVDQLAQAGVTSISGDVVGDGSRYDDEFYAPDWVAADRGVEAGPVDALLVNDARVTGQDARSENPSLGAAQELAATLRSRGITVGGGAATGTAADGASELASVESVALPGVVAEMLTTSDNNTAESLLKELGHSEGPPGTRQAGLAVVRQQLKEWGADLSSTTLTDASGLSVTNLVPCSVIHTVLVRSGHADDLESGLPLAGESGALSDVFVGTPVEGRLAAKTGTLANAPFDADPPAAKGLAGYLSVRGGGRIEFTLLLNGPTVNDEANYRPVWDDMVAALASFPSGPRAGELGPRR
ncbi:MAG: D-alanyl-D-alanine carboxypeptidase [Actinomycetota bacterium]|nr:D-alanyl-D-alanine carboxypeptidase [Actinomycetota bacterium]